MSGEWPSTNAKVAAISCRPQPGRQRWTVMSPWEFASSLGSCPELSRPTHAYRKVTEQKPCRSYQRNQGGVLVVRLGLQAPSARRTEGRIPKPAAEARRSPPLER